MKRIFSLGLLLAFGAAAALLIAAEPRGIVICQYNLENYVGDDQTAIGERRAKPKSEKEIAALIRIIKEINPDILGVCEMGSRERFADFAARLRTEGLGYIDSEYVDGPDRDRHLALFSRFPIVARQSLADVPFSIGGMPEKVRRGFLDVTIQINRNYQLRLIGAHLKSKLLAAEDEAVIRRHEAHCLRMHLEAVLRAGPDVNLVCYGDFNDLKNAPGFREIVGERGSPAYMADLWASDAIGDRWTHFWRAADLYSRIDFILVSNGAAREVVRDKSTVYRSPYWNEASDHRAVYATLVPVEKR